MRRARKATIYIYKWCKTAQIGRQSKDKDNGIKWRRRERGIAIKSNKERSKSHREGHREYRTPLRYITGRKTPRNNSNEAEQNKTKQKQKSHTFVLYNFTNLALELHVGLTKVRASPGAVECTAVEYNNITLLSVVQYYNKIKVLLIIVELNNSTLLSVVQYYSTTTKGSVHIWVNAGRPGGSVGNLETFWRWDVSSNLGSVTRTRIFPHKKNKKA